MQDAGTLHGIEREAPHELLREDVPERDAPIQQSHGRERRRAGDVEGGDWRGVGMLQRCHALERTRRDVDRAAAGYGAAQRRTWLRSLPCRRLRLARWRRGRHDVVLEVVQVALLGIAEHAIGGINLPHALGVFRAGNVRMESQSESPERESYRCLVGVSGDAKDRVEVQVVLGHAIPNVPRR